MSDGVVVDNVVFIYMGGDSSVYFGAFSVMDSIDSSIYLDREGNNIESERWKLNVGMLVSDSI